MYLQGVDSVYDLVWSRWDEDGEEHVVTYGDVFQENEREFSRYNFEVADTEMLYRHFREHEAEALRTIEARLPIPAYDHVLKCSHAFNMLDARGVDQRHRPHRAHRPCARPRAQGRRPLPRGRRRRARGRGRGRRRGPGRERGGGRMSTLLIEIGAEELPYKVCESVIRQLEGAARSSRAWRSSCSAEERLLRGGRRRRVLVSPRRIAVLVDGVPAEQLAQVQEFRGPKAEVAYAEDGTLTKAGAGFARSKGAAAEDMRREVVDGTEFVFVSVEAERRAARDVVPGWSRASSPACRSRAACAGAPGRRARASTCGSRAPSAGWSPSSTARP